MKQWKPLATLKDGTIVGAWDKIDPVVVDQIVRQQDEIERLKTLNAELLEALEECKALLHSFECEVEDFDAYGKCTEKARAAIAKAKEE